MSIASVVPQSKPLNPIQQWRYFKQPRIIFDWCYGSKHDFFPVHFRGREYTVALTPKAAQAVFTSDPDFYDAFWKDSFAGMNGEGSLWVLIGDKHRRERALFAPAVHASHFRAYGEVIRDITRANLESWQPGETIKAIDTTLAISLDIIMRLVFGVEDKAVLQEGRKVISALTGTAHPLIVFFPQLQRPWNPLWQRYVSAKTDLYAWMDKVIGARRAGNENPNDVLGYLIAAKDEDGNPYSDAHIRNELLSILTAGHMTTGTALAWAFYELGRHPEVLEKLRAELEPLGVEPDPVSYLPLPYLSAVCNETIRLHPILAECARVPMQPMELLGQHITPGQALVVSIVGIHHDPATFPEPDSFKPERFIERTYSNFEFLPFGGGHRRCLGSGLAEFSMRIVLAEVVQHWDFETAAEDFDTRHDLAMGPQKGVPLRILGHLREGLSLSHANIGYEGKIHSMEPEEK